MSTNHTHANAQPNFTSTRSLLVAAAGACGGATTRAELDETIVGRLNRLCAVWWGALRIPVAFGAIVESGRVVAVCAWAATQQGKGGGSAKSEADGGLRLGA